MNAMFPMQFGTKRNFRSGLASCAMLFHFTQVLPDIDRDRRQGLIGLPQAMGKQASAVVAAILMTLAAAAIALGPVHRNPTILAIAAILSVGVLVTGLTNHAKAAFRLTLATATAVVAAFLLSGTSLAQ